MGKQPSCSTRFVHAQTVELLFSLALQNNQIREYKGCSLCSDSLTVALTDGFSASQEEAWFQITVVVDLCLQHSSENLRSLTSAPMAPSNDNTVYLIVGANKGRFPDIAPGGR